MFSIYADWLIKSCVSRMEFSSFFNKLFDNESGELETQEMIGRSSGEKNCWDTRVLFYFVSF